MPCFGKWYNENTQSEKLFGNKPFSLAKIPLKDNYIYPIANNNPYDNTVANKKIFLSKVLQFKKLWNL